MIIDKDDKHDNSDRIMCRKYPRRLVRFQNH